MISSVQEAINARFYRNSWGKQGFAGVRRAYLQGANEFMLTLKSGAHEDILSLRKKSNGLWSLQIPDRGNNIERCQVDTFDSLIDFLERVSTLEGAVAYKFNKLRDAPCLVNSSTTLYGNLARDYPSRANVAPDYPSRANVARAYPSRTFKVPLPEFTTHKLSIPVPEAFRLPKPKFGFWDGVRQGWQTSQEVEEQPSDYKVPNFLPNAGRVAAYKVGRAGKKLIF